MESASTYQMTEKGTKIFFVVDISFILALQVSFNDYNKAKLAC